MAALDIRNLSLNECDLVVPTSSQTSRPASEIALRRKPSTDETPHAKRPRDAQEATALPNQHLLSLFEAKSTERHFQPKQTVLLHGAPADAIFLVTSGTIRCCTIGPDGSRQIFSFATKGAFVGISDFAKWHFTAEAVDHVIVKVVPRSALEHELSQNIPLRQEIRAHICHLLEQREQQLLSVINIKATERLFQFLTDFAKSRPKSDHIALPMCRRDIADHLGLSVETISRALGELKRAGRVDLVTREKYRICHKD